MVRGLNFDNQRRSRELALQAFIGATFSNVDGVRFKITPRSWNSHAAVVQIKGQPVLYIIAYNFGLRMEFRPPEGDGWSLKVTNQSGQGMARSWLQSRFEWL